MSGYCSLFVLIEGLALGLLLLKCAQHATLLKHSDRHESRRNILLVMAQDGIGYFACTPAITTLNLVLLNRVSPNLRNILLCTQGALQNILCSRLLLHVRSVNDSTTSTLGSPMSSMAFTHVSVNVSRTTTTFRDHEDTSIEVLDRM